MSLSNFQLITSSSVPLGCLLTYNAPIVGCSTDDFKKGSTCSAGCVRALQRIEDALEATCEGVSAPARSVLDSALSGSLVDLLCPSGKTVTTTARAGQSSTAGVVVTQSSQSIPRIGTFTPIPPQTTTLLTSTTTTSSSSSTEASSTEDDAGAETSTSSSEPEPQTTETQQTTVVAPAPVQTTSPSVVANPTQTTGAQQTNAPPQSTSDTVLGGGSPFDVATVSLGSRRLMDHRWLVALLFANVFVFLLLR
jgi:hypothetical protein